MIWDAVDRPAPFAGRVQVEEEQAEPPPLAPAVADGPRVEGTEAASASTAPIASTATATGVAAMIDLPGDTAPPPTPETTKHSAERRVGQEGAGRCESRGAP